MRWLYSRDPNQAAFILVAPEVEFGVCRIELGDTRASASAFIEGAVYLCGREQFGNTWLCLAAT